MPDSNEWHLDKKVPISLIGAILIQTFGFGVWAENLNERIGELERTNPAVTAEFARLEAAREAANLSLNTMQGDVKSLLELARRNEIRNVRQDQEPPH